MTNKPFSFEEERTHSYTYEASDENNENYLMESQDDCGDQFDDNDF